MYQEYISTVIAPSTVPILIDTENVADIIVAPLSAGLLDDLRLSAKVLVEENVVTKTADSPMDPDKQSWTLEVKSDV
jgi:hypothetical protein